MSDPFNVQIHLRHIVRDIRSRIVFNAGRTSAPDETQAALLPLREEIIRLGHSYQQLVSIRHNVGRMPASPHTLRARFGSFLVRMVRRMLFWYTPQVHAFHNGTVEMGESLCAVVEKQFGALQRLHVEIADLRSELRVRRGGAAVQAMEPAAAEPGYDHLVFCFHNRRMGPEEQRQSELRDYVDDIQGRTPPAPEGPWLDIRCGRGDWLQMSSVAGRDVVGLEDNLAAIEHCKGLGLKVIAGDPLTQLRIIGDSTHSLISALQVIDRYPAVYIAQLLREAVRVLKPEGFFLLEADDPASLVSAADGLWADPEVRRPWPVSRIEFFLEYFGLQVVSRYGVKPYSTDERLPFGELEFIQRLNSHLFGPRRYALIARRPAGDLSVS
jgi:SAM-dependent methyltransferase